MDAKYQQARQLLAAGKVKAAQTIFREIFVLNPKYKSVCYFLGKCAYLQGKNKEVKHYLKLHLDGRARKNIGPAFKYLCLLACKEKQYLKAQHYLAQAEKYGLKATSLAKLQKQLTQAVSEPTTMAFTYQKLSKKGTPIASCKQAGFKGAKFFIHGLPPKLLVRFQELKTLQLTVTYPQKTDIPGYLTCRLTDGRTLYKDYLPYLPSLYYRSAFNDYLEDDKYFKFKWEKSRVFSLLLVPGFSLEIVAKYLEANDLLDRVAAEHLQSCQGLVSLKEAGEILPVSAKEQLSDLDLLKEFGFICAKECGKTIHLASKCRFESQLRRALKAKSKVAFPYRKLQEQFRPSQEQARFINWLKKNDQQVISLLGVGGSGKTYTLSKLLDPNAVLALAPTHKARLNLADHGFSQNDTVQHLLFKLEAEPELVLTGIKVILIDEISMVTTQMLAQLFDKLGPGYRYLLAGDDQQLPPVSQDLDALNVCGDLMGLIKQEGSYYEFKTNLRCQNKQTAALIAAIRAKNLQLVTKKVGKFTGAKRDMLNYKYFHPALEDCMILAHRNLTVGKINQQYYRVLTKDGRAKTPFFFKNDYGHGGFFEGAQVVFYQNDDEKQRYGYTNSEFGIVTELHLEDKEPKIKVKTASNEYELPLYVANRDLFLAYALTIHKAQGSGSRRVYVLEAANDSLLYTAVSRSREELFFVDLDASQVVEALSQPVAKKRNVYWTGSILKYLNLFTKNKLIAYGRWGKVLK